MSLTILGGKGFVGGAYVDAYYHHAVGNIVSVNAREDYDVHSKDVLHFISTVHNYNIFDNPQLDIDVNLKVLVQVLESWRSYQTKTGERGVFNFISSWSVYGNQKNPFGVKEDAVCDPKGFYIITKRCAEQLLQSYCETYGLKYRILRLCNVVGPGDKASTKKNPLQYNLNRIYKNEDVEFYGDGAFYRDFIHVEDAAVAIDLVINKGNENEIYNIGNGLTWDFKSIISYARQYLKSTSKIVFTEPTEFQKLVPVSSFYSDNSKLMSLGYRPVYTDVSLFDAVIEASKEI